MSTAPRSTPFGKVLVANRGEIALRVMRSARALGLRTVAVYSAADAQARHVREADEAVCIGDALPSQSYLDIPAILDAARRTGADAVHPGYGFLAENATFAQACRTAGLVFIGPSPEAIAAMGNKAGAKRLMLEAGVPCVPGYQGEDQSEVHLRDEAARIGYPVMIKAVAGGGGRGMRLVVSADGFDALLRSAKSEAQNAFGDPTVILERAIAEPRHVEIQVFADRHGHAVHLGERDCSVQRRHQKLIEETPSPAVPAALRDRMGATAVAAAKAIGYEGAGTLEFLLDRDGNFYFMEMNTRLQVEHPVTEAVTGLDLVAMQLRVAAGEPLGLQQEDIRFSGHAIEVRLCAEDAQASFLPQSGRVALWAPPATLRVEHALRDGAEVPPFYDSMIAKLVAHGPTRADARRALRRGLEDLVALGVRTNQAFLARCLAHPVFADGDATTAFIGSHLPALLKRDDTAAHFVTALAAVLLREEPRGVPPPGERLLVNRLPVPMRFEMDSRDCRATLTAIAPAQYRVSLGESEHRIAVTHRDGCRLHAIVDGVTISVAFHREGRRLWVSHLAETFEIVDSTLAASTGPGNSGSSDGRVRASMNGRIVAVAVVAGDRVRAGQTLLTLEAMKMEHPHVATVSGEVIALHAAVGQQVQAGRVVVEIRPEPAAPA